MVVVVKVPDLREVIKEYIPESKKKKLLGEYEEIKREVEELEEKVREKRKELREKEKLLEVLGLIERKGGVSIRGEKTGAVADEILSLGEGAEFTFKDITAKGYSRGIVWRVVNTLIKQGKIEKVDKGRYRVVSVEGEDRDLSGEGSEEETEEAGET